MAILLVPSEQGRGHARRMATLAQALIDKGRAVLVTPDAGAFLLPSRSLGVVAGLPARDAGQNARAHRAPPVRTAEWTRALRDLAPEMIVSDVDPWPVAAAAELGVPGVLVGNFTWSDVFPSSAMDAAYARATATFQLPLALPMRGAKDVTRIPHLVWPRPPSAREAGPLRVVVALGIGNAEALGTIRAREPTELLVPTDSALKIATEGPVTIKPLDVPPEHAMPTADAVIAKGSHVTIAEAIGACAPLLLVERRSSPEDALVGSTLEKAGVARRHKPGAPIDLPTRRDLAIMGAAYGKDAPWSECDPDVAARAILALLERQVT